MWYICAYIHIHIHKNIIKCPWTQHPVVKIKYFPNCWSYQCTPHGSPPSWILFIIPLHLFLNNLPHIQVFLNIFLFAFQLGNNITLHTLVLLIFFMNVQVCVSPLPSQTCVASWKCLVCVHLSLISGAGAETPPHLLCSASMPLLDIKGRLMHFWAVWVF